MSRSTLPSGPSSGFTLVELIVTMFILVVGILALASVAVSAGVQTSLARARTEMSQLADSRLELLRGIAASQTADTVQLAVGGSTTTSVALHADTVVGPSGRTFIRRWAVVAGPVTTRRVTLRIIPQVDTKRTPAALEFTTQVGI